MVSSSHKTYHNSQVTGVSQAEQVGLLLEAAAKHIDKAAQAIERSDHEQTYLMSQKAKTIIAGLASSFNESAPDSEDIIRILKNFYGDMLVLIQRMIIKNDLEACQSIAQSLRVMADTWHQVAEKEKMTKGPIRSEPANIPKKNRDDINFSA